MTEGVERRVEGIVALAAMAGVSASTVSRALANNPVVAEATRARVHALAAAHGFRLNQVASAFRRGRAEAIGVVVPLGHEVGQTLSDPFFMALLGPLADALADAGFDLLLSRVIPRDGRWLADLVDARRTDGLILIGQSDQFDAIEAVARRGAPVVVWGARRPGAAQLTVGTDNEAGGRLAAEHLISRGRRRLAFLGDPGVPEIAARLRGFAAAVTAAGAVRDEMLPVHLTTSAAHRDVAAFLTDHAAPDGVVAASDVIAMGAMQALAERGLRVPEDVAVVGYDDVALARLTTPALTTVRQDVARGARLLVELLLRRIAGERAASVELAPELVVRGSS